MSTNYIMYKGRMTAVADVIRMKAQESKAKESVEGRLDQDVDALREEYKAKFGKYPSSNMKTETLKAKLQETSEA